MLGVIIRKITRRCWGPSGWWPTCREVARRLQRRGEPEMPSKLRVSFSRTLLGDRERLRCVHRRRRSTSDPDDHTRRRPGRGIVVVAVGRTSRGGCRRGPWRTQIEVESAEAGWDRDATIVQIGSDEHFIAVFVADFRCRQTMARGGGGTRIWWRKLGERRPFAAAATNRWWTHEQGTTTRT
jgi:hypothetical protein